MKYLFALICVSLFSLSVMAEEVQTVSSDAVEVVVIDENLDEEPGTTVDEENKMGEKTVSDELGDDVWDEDDIIDDADEPLMKQNETADKSEQKHSLRKKRNTPETDGNVTEVARMAKKGVKSNGANSASAVVETKPVETVATEQKPKEDVYSVNNTVNSVQNGTVDKPNDNFNHSYADTGNTIAKPNNAVVNKVDSVDKDSVVNKVTADSISNSAVVTAINSEKPKTNVISSASAVNAGKPKDIDNKINNNAEIVSSAGKIQKDVVTNVASQSVTSKPTNAINGATQSVGVNQSKNSGSVSGKTSGIGSVGGVSESKNSGSVSGKTSGIGSVGGVSERRGGKKAI